MSQRIDLDEARRKLSECKDAPDYAAWAAYRGANLIAELEASRAEIVRLKAIADKRAAKQYCRDHREEYENRN